MDQFLPYAIVDTVSYISLPHIKDLAKCIIFEE